MLSSEFTLLVIVANAIGWPVAWWIMNRWLDTFVYHIDLGPIPFLLSGALSITIAILTVSYQAVRAARLDPIDTLHYE